MDSLQQSCSISGSWNSIWKGINYFTCPSQRNYGSDGLTLNPHLLTPSHKLWCHLDGKHLLGKGVGGGGKSKKGKTSLSEAPPTSFPDSQASEATEMQNI